MYGVSEIVAPVKTLRALELKRVCAAAIASLAWFALVVQVYFDISDALANNLSVTNGLVQYFSFFTIQTNMLIALILTVSFARPQAEPFLMRPSVNSALANYIVIVGVVYALLLRHLWDPQGLQFVADRVLHDAIPALYPLYWLVFHPKGRLRWIDPVIWLIYPIVYFAYILLRGAVFGIYPYPFVDVIRLGYSGVAINAMFFLAAFFALGVFFAGVDRALAGRERRLLAGLAEPPNSDK
ncbi:Pr6Pr family membrane protein [Methylocapsa acidiphila]|uniref:Pr6Pr family membrane protein n=1 Tax=Methylocapsa acidiphila TaxID=133552 RepID=UPI0003FD9B1F|nr:Pr6Pr family membrane protein [Methylocapsa acidiphila]